MQRFLTAFSAPVILAILVVAAPARAQAGALSVTREHVAGDVYHYEFVVRVGSTANAQLHIHRVVRERAPFFPRPSRDAILMLHGDFATFVTNFVPVLGTPASSTNGVATWLAQRGIDVWGVDRRYTNAPADVDANTTDFAGMGLAEELGDLSTALAFARGVRVLTDASFDRMTLVGFSRGGMLAYAYASFEAARPASQRHLKGLVPLDVYVSVSPEDEAFRQYSCDVSSAEYGALAAGFADSNNFFQIELGQLALSAPDDPSDIYFPGYTNRTALLDFVGNTYFFFAPSEFYHLNAPILDAGVVTDLRETNFDVVAKWLASAPAHSSMREEAETDALVCGNAPVDVPLSRIRIPLLLIAAEGGYGEHAIFSTTQVSSTDISTMVIRRLPVGQTAEDFGHGDILYARDAAQLAWQPLLSWLRSHE